MADPTYYVVYEDATGDALRAGYSSMGAGAGETERTDLAFPAKIRKPGAAGNMHRWTGSAWTEVAQPAAEPAPNEVLAVDLEFTSSAIGVCLKAPDDDLWRVTVDNNGNLVTTEIV